MITDLTSEEIYAQLRKELEKRLQSDSRLLAIAEKIKQNKADFRDTAEYSQIVARHISALIQQKVGTNSALGIEFVCKELLKDHYSSINDVLGTVQAIVDEKNNIHIAPQKAPFPQERVNKVAHALMDPRVPIEVIKRRAGAPVENVANSFHDDYIKENAKFRNDAGLKCYINRTTDGNCCDWCTKMAGRYVYGEHPDDVFRRHDNCGCKTIYESGRTRQDVWTKKSWEVPDVADGAYKPTKLSFEQGKALEKKNLRKYHGLTRDGEGGIIKENITIGRSLGAAGKNYPVKLPDGNHAKFAEGTEIIKIKVFAGKGTDKPIRNAIFLENDYGISADKWQKVRGEGVILFEGQKRIAEVHWYEADDERYDIKVKRWLDES